MIDNLYVFAHDLPQALSLVKDHLINRQMKCWELRGIYKDFDTDEYLIINVKEGSGADTRAIIFECQIPNSECTFSCSTCFIL